MTGTGSQLSSWLDLAALPDVTAKATNVLVIDVLNVIDAECTDLAPGSVATAAGPPASGAAPRSASCSVTLAALTLGAAETGSGTASATGSTRAPPAPFAVASRTGRTTESGALGTIVTAGTAIVTLA